MSFKDRLKQVSWKHPALWEGYKLLRRAYRTGRVRRSRPPLTAISLELTNRCNLACTMCPNRLMQRERGTMSREVFDRVIEQVPDGSMRIIFALGMGEPLLHPDLVYFLRAARPKTHTLFTNTNGLLFNKNEDFMAELLRSGVNHVHFSAEGYDAATYESTRQGARFEDFLANLKLFKGLRDRLKAEVKVDLNYCLVREHTTGEFRRIFETYGPHVDTIHFSPLNNQAHPDIPYRLDEKICGFRYYRTDRQNVCYHLWSMLHVLWDGRVAACPCNYEGDLIVGDVWESPLLDIWRGEGFRALRSAHREKRFPGRCSSCFEIRHDVIDRAHLNSLIRKRAGLPRIERLD